MTYFGKVAVQTLFAGSKSEHQAVVLLTLDGPLKLRRPDGNPFADPELEKLVGQDIVCEGQEHQGQLLMTKWSDLPQSTR